MSKNTAISESILRSMVESFDNLLIWAVDTDMRYIFFNNSHKEKMKQFWAADIELGKDLLGYIDDPDYKAAAKKQYEAVFQNGYSGVSLDELTDCDGNVRYFENYGNPVLDAGGNVIGAVLYTIEVTDRVKAEKELERVSITDKLTGLFNRAKLDAALEQEFARAARYGRGFSLLLMDIDHFKEVNDNFGHPVGDGVLSEFGKILLEYSRHVDTPGRWGGEEFLIICPETTVGQARIMAEKIRQVIKEHRFAAGITLTCSFGVAEFQGDDTLTGIICRADKALYEAKHAGRNRVASAEK
jgi:diguanylate cyclase (GGDEF)-like protein